MSGSVVEVIGDHGAPVLVLPGGAATSRDFLPGVAHNLPDNRVILWDRPGTGRNVAGGEATLRTGADGYAAVVREAGMGPALVVGQSLGGAVAVQLAVDHPDVVSGVVLIDPTPFNDAAICRWAVRLFGVLALPGRVPVFGSALDRGTWRLMTRRSHVADDNDARASLEAMVSSATLVTTWRALDTLISDGQALTPRMRALDVPAVLITADRKPGHAVRKAHDEIAAALGARIVTWPGAVHAEQLRRPDRVYDVIRDVIRDLVRELPG